MKLLFTLFAVGQLQLIDYNTVFRAVSSNSNYLKHNMAQRSIFEFSRNINKFRGMSNPSNIESTNEKIMAQPAKKSRMKKSSEKINTAALSVLAAAHRSLPVRSSTLVKTNLYSPIEFMYQWYDSCRKRVITQETESESY